MTAAAAVVGTQTLGTTSRTLQGDQRNNRSTLTPLRYRIRILRVHVKLFVYKNSFTLLLESGYMQIYHFHGRRQSSFVRLRTIQ